jgi:UDP-N-acetylglucosamine 1-carboxyvinyltransferase
MDKLLITGGTPLQGDVVISGAKNAALPIIAAALLTADPLHLGNVPHLADIQTLSILLKGMGCSVTRTTDENIPQTDSIFTVHAANIHTQEAPYDLVKTMRASILVLGPLLARFGKAKVSLPGGCAIGQRPVDQHIKGLQALGAHIVVEGGYIYATAPYINGEHRLQGAVVRTDMITVTGTENLLMAACLARGETVLENAAREPEVTDLAHLLVAMGANISGIGTDRLVIQGVERLHGARYDVMPDRIEAGTFLCAVAMTGGKITLHNTDAASMGATLDKLRECGLNLNVALDGKRIDASMPVGALPKPMNFQTREYPGFATDMQAQIMAVNTIADGVSTISEHIFENRFMHVQELCRLGADIAIDGHTAIVRGVKQLNGAPVIATDLRASACLVIAALAAKGQSTLDRVYHLDRGYEYMETKLRAIGANIERINNGNQSKNSV